jgi:hypothetical protein
LNFCFCSGSSKTNATNSREVWRRGTADHWTLGYEIFSFLRNMCCVFSTIEDFLFSLLMFQSWYCSDSLKSRNKLSFESIYFLFPFLFFLSLLSKSSSEKEKRVWIHFRSIFGQRCTNSWRFDKLEFSFYIFSFGYHNGQTTRTCYVLFNTELLQTC